ncbi:MULTISPECIES: CAP domain-containing protein [Nitrosomonas]|uniref:Calcium-binding protein n=1 Tax=Nitrosomonas communis TaxID=44574 RepID=A0A0F7KIQ3_9PROT|nr:MULTISPECIES: CAP domain-containing protein [Nitrosomonas]AKH38794.1 calcium-binding protein [Nitrosomonas communis]TYP88758.1 hemolysin type calcium-binding protein [Nitrosomonas communis]UVS60903.1 CAP domain-containing protein [Nitrosomonas sp. PLL12]
MSQANAYEQHMLQLINAERAKVGAQPLAFDDNLNTAAERHSNWMIDTDTFSHTGINGSDPGDRMESADYDFSGSWAWGENIAWRSARSPSGFADEVEQMHISLMNSPGHKANILNDNFREIGIGLEVGPYSRFDDAAFITQDFAKTSTNPFLVGVAFDDLDGDKFYDINEGLDNLTVTAKNNTTGTITTTQTSPAGGYQLELAAGNYTVSFTGNGIATTTYQVSINSKNVEQDLVDPTLNGGTSQSSTDTSIPQLNTIIGTSSSDELEGTSGADAISGLRGSDQLHGHEGKDTLDGGSGNDILWGGADADTLTGGTGRDIFVFDTKLDGTVDKITDFTPGNDIIYLENNIFTNLTSGDFLSARAFYIGTQAHDSTDRIIYNTQTGALSYDADGIGGASAQQFAQLTGGLALTNEDFYVG